MIRFLKNWTLPIAMLVGAVSYYAFANLPFLFPLKGFVNTFVSWLTPILIFTMLFITFCKVSLKDLRPQMWHLWLVLIQIVCCLVFALLACLIPEDPLNVVFQSSMVCFICPTATAAAVVTLKLGGDASTLVAYTVMSNLVAAVIVPVVFPFVCSSADISFMDSCISILGKVFPLLICPLIASVVMKSYCPTLHKKISDMHHMTFYLWAVALSIVVAQTIRSIVNSEADTHTLLYICISSLFICLLQFYLGKRIGGIYCNRISGGQALGQKNTIFAIWLSYTYLNPLSSLGPGAYVIWQNVINSWQLWKSRRLAG